MIRPLTIVTCLLACGSGLYLYQSKHEVQLLDRTIERTVHDTSALREQSRLLAAEWTMLNDPERLRQFSDTYLSLKTITPSQFTSLADLDNRLPAPQAEVMSHGTDQQELISMSAETEPQVAADPAPSAVADQDLPIPPIPATPRTAPQAAPQPTTSSPAVASRPADVRTAERASVSRPPVTESQARPAVVADSRPSEQRPSEQRPADQHPAETHAAPRVAVADARASDPHPSEPRVAQRSVDARMDNRQPAVPAPRPIVLAAPRPLPATAPAGPAPAPAAMPTPSRPAAAAASTPYGGSLLGMARGSMPPAPRPTPVNASYNSN
jgi:hypothetical protein